MTLGTYYFFVELFSHTIEVGIREKADHPVVIIYTSLLVIDRLSEEIARHEVIN